MLLEEDSFTTPENLINAHTLIKDQDWDIQKITIFCDSIRVPKVITLSLQVFYHMTAQESLEELYHIYHTSILKKKCVSTIQEGGISYDMITVEGIDLNRTRLEISEQIIASLVEQSMIHNHTLRNTFHTLRRKIFGVNKR